MERPEAAILATCKEGRPSARTILFKGLLENRFLFYTNYMGRKAKEIESNPNVCLIFYWDPLHRQVIIEGEAHKVSREISEKYFQTRQRGSQLAAWASDQDTVIPHRQFLLERYENQKCRFAHKTIPCPPFWGGFAITPSRFEFLQGREKRLNERIRYRQEGDLWIRELLAP